jgi:hypothetical protein
MGGDKMRIPCKEPGCGTTIQTSAEDTTLAPQLMAKHVAELHGSIEARHTKVLTACLAAFASVANGQKMQKTQARTLYNQISDLLKIPHLPEEVKENATVVPAPSSSSPGVGDEAIPSREDVLAAKRLGNGKSDQSGVQPIDGSGHSTV